MNKTLKTKGHEPTPPKLQELSNGDLKKIGKIAESLQNVSDANQALSFMLNASRDNPCLMDGAIRNGIGYLNGLLAERTLDLGFSLEIIAKDIEEGN